MARSVSLLRAVPCAAPEKPPSYLLFCCTHGCLCSRPDGTGTAAHSCCSSVSSASVEISDWRLNALLHVFLRVSVGLRTEKVQGWCVP